VAALLLLAGCARSLDLGSDILWSTSFENGSISDFAAPPGTGDLFISDPGGPSDAAVAVTTEQAHTGRYAAKITSLAVTPALPGHPVGGGGLYKEDTFPQAAYYSAWFFVPQLYETPAAWTVFKFMVPTGPADAGSEAAPADAATDADAAAFPSDDSIPSTGGPVDSTDLLGLSLLSAPGRMSVVLSDSRRAYLESPLPDPVPIVPIGRWFQIECWLRNVADATGELKVWLDGALIYDVVRPMAPTSLIYFVPCSLSNSLKPESAVLYIDDVAVSWARVGPNGVLEAPR
jgi:hypothetical protein